jgi:hypothetical protein
MFVFACRIYLRLQKDEIPSRFEILSVKVWFILNFDRNGGCFDIAFLKNEGAIEKTNCIKKFIAISTTKIKKEFSFRILLVEIWQIY